MQTHAQVWSRVGGSEKARTIVAAEFKRALEAPTLDAFDDGRKAGDAPDEGAPDGCGPSCIYHINNAIVAVLTYVQKL